MAPHLSRIQREKRGFVLQIQQGMARKKSDMQIAEEEMGTNWRIPRMGMFAFPTTKWRGGGTPAQAEERLALAVERAQKQWEEAIKDEVEMVSEWFEPIEDDRELRVDDKGKLQGRARCTWPEGQVYEGQWKDGRQHGRGTERLEDGEVFVRQFQDGQRHGKGMCTFPSGNVEVAFYDQDEPKGRAVKLSADRTRAWLFMDGKKEREVSVAEAGAGEQRKRAPWE